MPIWEGMLFGMLLQLSVGPVCMAVLQRSVSVSFRAALWMTLGVVLVDAAYMLGAIAGLSLLLQIPLVKNVVMIGGAAILIWFGIGCFRAKKVDQQSGDLPKGQAVTAPASVWYGIILTLTNPLTILFWSGVFGSLIASQAIADHVSLAGFALGCLLATVLFLTSVAALGRYLSIVLRPEWIKRLDWLVGVFLIVFAIILLHRNF